MKTILVTGGAGFIGSALVRYLINETDVRVVNLDKLTYAGNLASLASIANSERYHFVQGDIGDRVLVADLLSEFQPDYVMHLAAESHVDRSIDSAGEFIQTNIVGTYNLLECVRQYWGRLSLAAQQQFRFHHISTDEVFGDLGEEGGIFTESTPYAPSSPYSASKAASDHLVHAWHRTYGLPIVMTNCSNNYGPYHFPEKLIPLVILNAMALKPIPVYGDGMQIRDWLYVEDHVKALFTVVDKAAVGSNYNIGGFNEKTNIEVVKTICAVLDKLMPERSAQAGASGFASLITFVKDRPGHDVRYAIDASKINVELDWKPQETFESGIAKTVQWYLDNQAWYQPILDNQYAGQRLGLSANATSGK